MSDYMKEAVPDMYDRIAEAHDASLDEDHTGCRAILKECMRLLAAAPAHDHFRNAAEMVAEPADVPDEWEYYYKDSDCPAADSGDPNCICWHDEGRGPYDNARHDDEDTFLEWRRVKAPAPAEVPMPEPDTHCYDEDEQRDVWSHSADQMRTYGERCRAAGDAAGYARGRKEVEISADSRGMFVARLENMQQQGDSLTAQEVLALLNDCDMLAARGEVKP